MQSVILLFADSWKYFAVLFIALELLMRAFQKPLNNIYKQRLDRNLKYIQTLRKQEY